MAASNTANVKIGVCRATFDGVDLGYTKGGCEVEVSTETHKVEVDQFGKSPINEVIMGRMVKAKVPMAETTIDKMYLIMPGASVVQVGGAKATGTVTYVTNPVAANTVVINGKTITFRAVVALPFEVLLGATLAATLVNLAAFLNASTDPALAAAQYVATATVVTATYNEFGTEGNAFALAAGTSGGTVSGAFLTGGTVPTSKRIDVTDGVGTNLLAIAKELRLHPIDKADGDLSEDFVIPLAMTPGSVSFAYKLEDERIFNTEFMGYPDSATRRLFYFGA